MIARKYRFHGRGSLRLVYTKGKAIRGQFFSMKYIHNEKRQHYRVAVVVSRKVHKSAVVRNRIRRRMFEIIRETMPDNTPALDLVFIVYSDQVASLPQPELSAGIRDQLGSAIKS